MSKFYKGWELIKAIEDGEIKDGTEFRVNQCTPSGNVLYIIRYKEKVLKYMNGSKISSFMLTDGTTFEVVEDEPEIDIQLISEIHPSITGMSIEKLKINEIIRAVNKLIAKG